MRRDTPFFDLKIPGFKKTFKISDDRDSVLIEQTLLNHDFRPPVQLSFEDYLRARYRLGYKKAWRNYVNQTLFSEMKKNNKGKGIGFDIPIPIKSQAFQKIFGGNSVGLQVVGNVTIDGGLRHEKRSEVKTAINRHSNYNFKMKQTQRFTVKGNVGQKVNVYVDQDSERPFEFDNAIRLEYKGFEDEVVESIEAGNVSLSLPATRFVTFSAKNSGLFGIKANMRLGNLKMTTIASQEKGQKQKLSISGGATSEENKIDDYEYRRGTYFFLNKYFREQFTNIDANGVHLTNDTTKIISRIEVYKSEDRYYNQADAIVGWAIADPAGVTSDPPDTSIVDQNHYKGYFKRLEQNTDYYVDKEVGYIAMNQPLHKGEVLAVAYRDSSGKEVGDVDFVPDPQGKSKIILKLLYTKNPIASDYTWDLEWKNVYYLGTRNIKKEGFELKLYFKPPSGDPQETFDKNGTPISYLTIFGLDKRDLNGNPKPDNILDDNPNIINWARGELIFPDLEPFRLEKYKTSDPKLYDKRVDAIYDTTDHQFITKNSNFYLSVSAKVRQTNYSLGFNIIEGSEEIVLDGRKLQSGRDYILDYFSGNLTILDERASDPNASLDITYESNQMFQINRKTILGTRWDYELFNNSFIGGTLLYLNQSTLDQKIRIGQDGPMQNFVWNLNTSLNFEPFFITKGLNALPLVQTKEKSTVKFEAEVAQIIPNPNSRNNKATGDKNGVVYVDDFEAAKRETPLGVMRRQWTVSSVPKVIPGWNEYNFYSDQQKNESRGHLIWYNPYEQVAIKEIWPERDVNPNVPQRVHVLNMRLVRKPEYGEHTWAGIMRYLSAGYADQSNSKFIEVWVRGDQGRVHIDFGQISEDAIPNHVLDTEDKAIGGIRNGLLDDGEDTGLDGIPNGKPGDDPNDDWSYTSGGANYEHINGTEGNLNDEGGRFPDTEDLNQNGSLDQRNDYFEFGFDLDKTSPDAELIAGGLGLDADKDYGWRMYRLPLAAPDTVIGNPQWTNIEYVRIWVDGAPQDTMWTQIAQVNLVGSEWKERGMAFADLDTTNYDAKNDTTVRVTVVNTYDNPDYTPPPGVAGETDQITKVVRREQALVLRVKDLPPGANGIAQKSFFQPQSYIDYKVMKMFVYGLDPFGLHMGDDSSTVELFFRFGADDHNYYEFRERVFPHWDNRNEMIIDLAELTGIKNIGETDKYGYLYKVTEDGDTLRVVGKPSLTNVRQLTAGVVNRNKTEYFTGEIWLNELRLTEVKKDKGMAMRARLDMKLADVLNVNAEMNRVDDDFRTVNERFGKGNNKLQGTINASFRMDKFLPQSLGLSIPINMGYQNSESSPKYFPGSDIVVSKKTANDSLLETIKTKSQRKTLSVSIKKTSRSRNPFIKYTLDALSASYSYAESFRSNSTIKEANNFTYNGNFGYNITFNPKASFKPFSWLGKSSFVKPLSSLSLFYLPKNLTYKFSFNRVQDRTLNRNGLVTPRYTFVMNQNFGTGIQPLRGFSLDYTYSRVNDLREVTDASLVTGDPIGALKGDYGPLTSLRQSFKTQFNPKLSKWLKINLSATTNFSYNNNIQQRELGKSAQNSQNYSSRITLTPKTLFQQFTRKKPNRRRPRATIPRKKKTKEENEKKGDKKGKEKEGSKISFKMINPLKLIALLGEKIQPISFQYSQQISSNSYGLLAIPPFSFQIGKSFNPGPVVQQNVGTNRGAFTRKYNMNSSTGLSLLKQLKVSFKYSYDNGSNKTTTTTGSISQTRWHLGEKNIFFPDWTVKWSGIEKIPLIKKFIQRASIDHGRSGRVVSKWLDNKENITNESVSLNYRPLIGLSMTLKNGMNCTVQFNQAFSENINKKSGSSGTRKKTSDINATVNYSKSGGFTLPIPFFKNKKIKNNIDFSMTFTKSLDVSEQKRGEEGSYQEWTRNEKWSLVPKLTYSFSSTVRGGMHFEFGRTKNKLYGETRIIEFGINVNIQISGR